MSTPKALTAHEVADLARLNISTIRRRTRRGEIPGAVNVGTAQRPIWRYDARRINTWMQRGTPAA